MNVLPTVQLVITPMVLTFVNVKVDLNMIFMNQQNAMVCKMDTLQNWLLFAI